MKPYPKAKRLFITLKTYDSMCLKKIATITTL